MVERKQPLLVVAGIIRKNGKILIAQRKDGSKIESGKWEFPGGKVEFGESPPETLAREIAEELGIEIDIREIFLVSSSVKKGKHIILLSYVAYWKSGKPKAIDVRDFRWVKNNELRRFVWTDADKPIVEKLLKI